MKFHALQAIVWALLILLIPVYTQSQTKPVKKGPAGSISGKVTIKGKGAPGILVGLRAVDSDGQQTSRYKAVTDQDGNYRITNVRPGTYQVMPAAPAFVISGETGVKTLIVTEGETVEGVDFALARGGVITGRVTDTEGRSLIEEQVILLPTEANTQSGVYPGARYVLTDDRGIYRIFGISEGKYRVAVGQSDDGFHGGRPRRTLYKQTFHPAVTNPSKATVIEVTEGSEVTNVDITVGRTLDTFSASGRIVDGDTGQPLPHIKYGVERIGDQGSSFSTSGEAANSRGEFKLESLMPGKYAVFIAPQANTDMRADSVPFELIDQDVTGLLVKTSKGASVSGVIVFARTDDQSALAPLSQMGLHADVQNENPGRFHSEPAVINPDGSFRVGGLQAGIVNFSLAFEHHNTFKGVTIMRLERDGVAQPGGVAVKSGEHVKGIRIVATYGTGRIRGHVKVENGELPPTARFLVWLTNLGDEFQRTPVPSPQIDSRGHFLVEGLLAGTYEVNANVFITGSRIRTAKQQVDVSDGLVTEVTVTLDLTKPGPGNP